MRGLSKEEFVLRLRRKTNENSKRSSTYRRTLPFVAKEWEPLLFSINIYIFSSECTKICIHYFQSIYKLFQISINIYIVNLDNNYAAIFISRLNNFFFYILKKEITFFYDKFNNNALTVWKIRFYTNVESYFTT